MIKLLYNLFAKFFRKSKKRLINKIIFLLGSNIIQNSRKNYSSAKSLYDVEAKVFSQNGEDGILDFIVTKLNINRPNFIEIGVQDYLESNTRFIYESYYPSGLIIDCQKNLNSIVKENINLWKGDLRIVEKFITSKNAENTILQNCDFDIDIFSLDIDGIDYWIIKNLSEKINPKVFVIEYNSIFGPQIEVTVPDIEDFSRENYHYSHLCYGASLRAFTELLKKKGYYLLGVNRLRNNAFFISNKFSKDKFFPNILDLSFNDFTNSLVRESRSEAGNLDFKTKKERKKIIEECYIIDVSNEKEEKKKLIEVYNENFNK